ncbi:glycosyltransferase [Limosilactobacillus kribbianus]|uniref:glycosyltransferase n=1 Tax=Limosilactobacillus kribbianus TaxID=2982695 RepID=UPI00226439EA|nr:glycosyltransferase [Limosilactobacillus kribbianus]
MNYFITSRQDLLTSAIELAQVKRLRIFDSLHQPATIVTLAYNFAHREVEKKLDVGGRVINLFQYFQKLPYRVFDARSDGQLAQLILHQSGFVVHEAEHAAYAGDKKRVQVVYNDQRRIYYIDYLDRFGFLDQRDFYDCGCRSHSEFYEDRGRVVTRQYYDGQGNPKLIYYYRGGDNNQPVLTMIRLADRGQVVSFDTEDDLRAYFLDQLVEDDPHACFISDRSDYTFKAFKKMKYLIPRYQVFHSAFTENGQPDGKLFTVYDGIKEMLDKKFLRGLISATQQETTEAGKRFDTAASYGIPVTYLDQGLLLKHIPFEQRKRGQIIAVARLTNVKRLDHLINTVITLHEKFPVVDLKIYGFDDSWNNYATSTHLKRLVKDKQAGDYIHFCGYEHDLTAVYETAAVEVLTSSYEGFAMALLEAQGHGCPAVSYDINYGPAEIIKDGESGRLLPAGDMHALYVTLAELLQNHDLLRQYSAHAQEAAAKYSFENVRKRWADFLKKERLYQE